MYITIKFLWELSEFDGLLATDASKSQYIIILGSGYPSGDKAESRINPCRTAKIEHGILFSSSHSFSSSPYGGSGSAHPPPLTLVNWYPHILMFMYGRHWIFVWRTECCRAPSLPIQHDANSLNEWVEYVDDHGQFAPAKWLVDN